MARLAWHAVSELCKHTHACAHTLIYKCTHVDGNTYKHAHTHTHRYKYTHAHLQIGQLWPQGPYIYIILYVCALHIHLYMYVQLKSYTYRSIVAQRSIHLCNITHVWVTYTYTYVRYIYSYTHTYAFYMYAHIIWHTCMLILYIYSYFEHIQIHLPWPKGPAASSVADLVYYMFKSAIYSPWWKQKIWYIRCDNKWDIWYIIFTTCKAEYNIHYIKRKIFNH